MKKLIVTKIDNYNYTLTDGKRLYEKNIEFYSKNKPVIGDIIYLSDKIFTSSFLSFIEPYNSVNLSIDDIIKIVSNNKEYYLQREYG